MGITGTPVAGEKDGADCAEVRAEREGERESQGQCPGHVYFKKAKVFALQPYRQDLPVQGALHPSNLRGRLAS